MTTGLDARIASTGTARLSYRPWLCAGSDTRQLLRSSDDILLTLVLKDYKAYLADLEQAHRLNIHHLLLVPGRATHPY